MPVLCSGHQKDKMCLEHSGAPCWRRLQAKWKVPEGRLGDWIPGIWDLGVLTPHAKALDQDLETDKACACSKGLQGPQSTDSWGRGGFT